MSQNEQDKPERPSPLQMQAIRKRIGELMDKAEGQELESLSAAMRDCWSLQATPEKLNKLKEKFLQA